MQCLIICENKFSNMCLNYEKNTYKNLIKVGFCGQVNWIAEEQERKETFLSDTLLLLLNSQLFKCTVYF